MAICHLQLFRFPPLVFFTSIFVYNLLEIIVPVPIAEVHFMEMEINGLLIWSTERKPRGSTGVSRREAELVLPLHFTQSQTGQSVQETGDHDGSLPALTGFVAMLSSGIVGNSVVFFLGNHRHGTGPDYHVEKQTNWPHIPWSSAPWSRPLLSTAFYMPTLQEAP